MYTNHHQVIKGIILDDLAKKNQDRVKGRVRDNVRDRFKDSVK